MQEHAKKIARTLGFAVALIATGAPGQEPGAAPRRQAEPPPPIYPSPKVPLTFNRLHDYPELVEAMRALVQGHPDLLTLSSLGKSVEGRDLWAITINNPATGSDRDKPAMYVDGNIHGNEIQGAEACLYLVWYLAENRGRVPKLKELTDTRAFYVVPTVNPDGRAFWFNGPNTTHSSRSGKSPRDDDRDGIADEDGLDDLNGDGQITLMRRKNPEGGYKVSPDDPRILVPVALGERGEYELLGDEGIDNDGDGLVNEDPPGGYDMNRNWPADWQPEHIQHGAGDFPLSWPETRSVARFVLEHPNIAGVQAFHNAGGMILRGPGNDARQTEYPAQDEQVAAEIGRVGERLLPFYKSMVIYKDLYNVHGGFVNWTYEHLGIFSFTNELWNRAQLLAQPATGAENRGRGRDDDLFAADKLLFGESFLPWTPVDHPLYGPIEVGGMVKQSQRIPPTFLIEELCHRNAAFVIHHADQMPLIVWDDLKAEKLGESTWSVTATLRNSRLIPSISAQGARKKVGLPDRATLSGDGLTVAAAGRLVNPDTGEVELQERTPATLRLEQGVGGVGVVRLRFFVTGQGVATLTFISQKGGRLEKTVDLRSPKE